MGLRRQLAAYSPVSAFGIARAASQLTGLGDDPRAPLRRQIASDYNASVTLCGSGTQALSVALRKALGETGPGAVVALPAFSCFDVASALLAVDARAVFYDVDRDTLSPDPVSLERALAAGARVAVTSPLYGIPQDWRSLEALADAHGAVLIQDAAQGFGATLDGKRLGALGQLSTLSFGRAKGWTGGNGGALLERGELMFRTDDLDEPGVGGELADIGGMMAQYAFGRPYGYALPNAIPSLRLGQTTFRAPKNERSISRAAAAALLSTRQAALREAEVRKRNASLFLEEIRECPNVGTISIPPEGTAGFLRLPLLLPRGMSSFRSQDRARMLGIATTYPAILPRLPEMSGRLTDSTALFPGASALVAQLITLPTHSQVTMRDVSEILQLLRAI